MAEHACKYRVMCGHLEMERDRLAAQLAEARKIIKFAYMHDQLTGWPVEYRSAIDAAMETECASTVPEEPRKAGL